MWRCREVAMSRGGDVARWRCCDVCGDGVMLWRGDATRTAMTIALLVVMARMPTAAAPPHGTSTGEWPAYHGDYRNHHYSPLAQITAENFKTLEVAWRLKTDNFGTRPEYKLEGTPLMVGGVVYLTAGTRRAVVAADAATGELRWVHREPEGARGAAAPRQLSGRG